MSRTSPYRTIVVTIWDDPDWRLLSAGAQWTYFMLLTQKDLTAAGTMSYNPRKWAKGCNSLSEAHVERCVYELQDHRFVYLDADTDEVLIRTYVRNDGIWKQPNMIRSACKSAVLVSSPLLRASLAFELARMPKSKNPDAAKAVVDTLAVLAPGGVPELAPEPFPNPSSNPSGTLPEPFPNPSAGQDLTKSEYQQVRAENGNPSSNPSGTLRGRVGGGGGGGGYCSSKSTTLFTPSKEREEENQAFQAFCEAYPKDIPQTQRIELAARWQAASNAHGADRMLKAAQRYTAAMDAAGTERKFAKNPVAWIKDGLFEEHMPDELEPYQGMDVVAWLDEVTARRDVNTAKRYATGDDYLPEWPAEYEGWTAAEVEAFRESDKDRWFREHRALHIEVLSRRYGGASDVA